MSGRGPRPPDQEALLSLKKAALPPRPRAALEGVLGLVSTMLESGISATLNEFEQQLFKLAEQAKSNDAQQRCFESLREIRRGRADVTPRLLIRIEDALASIEKVQQAPNFARMNRGQREEFSLVDPQEFEQWLALQEVASKAEIRHSQPLFALGQRFGVLAGSAAVEPDELPIGPHRLCDCLRGAAACLDVQLEHRVLLFRVFDRVCMTQLGALYDQINDLFIESRVLPNLQLSHARKRGDPAQAAQHAPGHAGGATHGGPGGGPGAAVGHGGGQGGHGAGGSHGGGHGGTGHAGGPYAADAPAGSFALGAVPGAHDSTPSNRGPAGAQHPGGMPAGGAGAAPSTHLPDQPVPGSRRGDAPGHEARAPATPGGGRAPIEPPPDTPALKGFSNPMIGWPGQPVPQPDHGGEPDRRELELFETMRDLLAGRRHSLGVPAPSVAEGGHQVRSEDVQSVLSALQNKPAPPMMMGGKLVSRSVSHLKQDMLNHLRQITPDGQQPRLSELDADTIDLVGMLFEHLSHDVKPDSSVQGLMTRLQIPLLRVALKDKSFFTRRTHPARQLLNSVAESGLFWLDDESDDRALVEKMRLVVDRASAEYDDQVDIFEDLLGDLSKHLGTITRKSEVAERRHVDAAKGRERLDSARATAAAAVSDRIGKRNPPALIRTLLEHAWTDVLALTLLRQGESSDAYRKRLAVADQLLGASLDGGGTLSNPDDPRTKALRQEVESGLSQVGYHGEDVQAVVKRLFGGGGGGAANDDPTSLTELAIKLKARSRLGSEGESEREPRPVGKAKAASDLTAEEQRVLERLRTIPFGTWFEFSINQQGDKAHRKLSWFSTVTGRCLFVNQRGVKAEEKTLEGLARDITRGLAHVVEAQKESLIDRAWSAIMSSLKQFTGKSPAVKPA